VADDRTGRPRIISPATRVAIKAEGGDGESTPGPNGDLFDMASLKIHLSDLSVRDRAPELSDLLHLDAVSIGRVAARKLKGGSNSKPTNNSWIASYRTRVTTLAPGSSPSPTSPT